jgi:hypothetical protein
MARSPARPCVEMARRMFSYWFCAIAHDPDDRTCGGGTDSASVGPETLIESWDTRLPSSRCIRSAPRHWWGLSRLVVWALQTALRLHGTDQKWHLSNELYTVLAKCCLHNVWHCLAETSARRAGLHRFRTTSPWRARSRNICAVPSDSVSTSTPSLPMGTALWTGKASPYRINSSVR